MYNQIINADVAVLTVLGVERNAAERAFGLDNRARFEKEGDIYWTGQFFSQLLRRNLTLVLYCQASAGLANTGVAATKLVERFRPSVVALMGIAAGRRGMIRIGDVAIPRQVFDYSSEVIEAGERRMRPEIIRMPHFTMQMVQGFELDVGKFHRETASIFGSTLQIPLGQADEFEKHVTQRPQIKEQATASGDVLIRDTAFLQRLADIHQDVRTAEMEAGGLVKACNNRHPSIPWIVVRAVSDFGDQFKDDQFHRLAASAAAAYLKCFMIDGLYLPSSPITEDASIGAGSNDKTDRQLPGAPSPMSYNVFLSYSWSNSAERRVLADKIGAIENVKVLVDDDFISPGDPIHSTVLKMIEAADCLVVLLTREGLQSREVWDEITRAHDRNKVIIPILAGGTKLEEIPWHFRDLRWVSYDLKNFDFVVERVIAAIRKRANPSAGIDSIAVPIRIGPPLEARNILESPHPVTLQVLLGLSWLYWILTGPWPLLWLFITSGRDLDIWWTTATKFSHLYLHSTCVGLFLASCLRYPIGALFASSAFKKTMWAILPPIIVATLVFILNDVSIGPELYGNDPLGFWLPLSSALQMLASILSLSAVLLVGFRTITHLDRRIVDIRVLNRFWGAILYGLLWLPMRAAYEMQSIPDARAIVHNDSDLRLWMVILLFIVVQAILVRGGYYEQRRYLVPVVAVLASSVIVLVALLCPHICVTLFRISGASSIYYGMFVAGLVSYVGMILYERDLRRHER